MSKDHDDLFGLVRVLVEAGILEETGFGGYKVATAVPDLKAKVDLLQRKVTALEKDLNKKQ